MIISKLRYVCLISLLLFLVAAEAQNTVVTGRVTDVATGEAMPYVNVSANVRGHATIGATSDLEGQFRVQAPIYFDTITLQFVGYAPAKVAVKPHVTQNIVVELQPQDFVLKTVDVTGKRTRYTRRNNPAVELMEQVIARKDSNGLQRQDYYQYRSHEKTELSLLGVNDSLRYKKGFRRLGFLFDNIQTSSLSGKPYMPVYFMENLNEHHYRKNPLCERRMLTGQKEIKFSKFIEPQTVEFALHEVFGDEINVYDNYIHILSNQVMSPMADFATRFYHYYLNDTLFYRGDTCIRISFTPANLRDVGFSGNLLVTKDQRHALRRIHLEVPMQSNINFVDNMEINQRYDLVDSQLVLTENKEVMEGSLYGMKMHARKELNYADYSFGAPMPEEFYTLNDVTTRMEGYNKRTSIWWGENRIAPLTKSEANIYDVPTQLNEITTYRVAMNTLMAFVAGYVDMGKWDYGPVENTLSWNDVEGIRLRVGAKTNIKLHPHWFASGFLAYGTKDQAWKYNAEVMYNFADKLYHQWEFPANLLTVGVEHNTEIPGQIFKMGTYDRLTLSLNRGTTDMMVMNHRYYAEYWRETMSQLSTRLRVEHRKMTPLASLEGNFTPITTATASVDVRYARNEKFYQSQRWRTTLNSVLPIIELNAAYNAPFLGSDYGFGRLQATLMKRSYLWSFGYADITLQGGTIFCKAAYPLLFVHQANQNWAYQEEAFSMMNYFEFVSDHYLQALLDYNFNGYIFNRIPLIRRLGWREVFAVKCLWGDISKKNAPGTDDLPDFVKDSNGNYRSYTLADGPYIEGNIGIDNIFKVLRVDLVHRFTYLDHPDIAEWGIRFRAHFSF